MQNDGLKHKLSGNLFFQQNEVNYFFQIDLGLEQ